MRNNIISKVISSVDYINNDKPLYIGVDHKNSIFLKALEDQLCHNLFPYQNAQEFIPYNLYFSINPEECVSVIQTIKTNHLHDFIYICNPPNKNIKKEDRFLIQQKLSYSNIVFRNRSIKNLWFPDTEEHEYMEYGLPKPDTMYCEDKQSIVVVNYRKSHSLNLLYHNLKQTFSDAVMLTSLDDLNYTQICSIFQQYKICIASGDSYDVLCAAANGSLVFSTETCSGVDSVTISSFDEIFNLVPDAINKYNEYNEKQKSVDLFDKYDFGIFSNKFTNISNNILRKPVIL